MVKTLSSKQERKNKNFLGHLSPDRNSTENSLIFICKGSDSLIALGFRIRKNDVYVLQHVRRTCMRTGSSHN